MSNKTTAMWLAWTVKSKNILRGDLDAVRSASSEGARLGGESGDLYSLKMMLMNLGLTALFTSELVGSRRPVALRRRHRPLALLLDVGELRADRAHNRSTTGCAVRVARRPGHPAELRDRPADPYPAQVLTERG